MNTQANVRASALGLSALLTLSILASINFMATTPVSDSLFVALASPASQTIVIEAKRNRA